MAWGVLIWMVISGNIRFELKKENIMGKCLLFISAISYPLYLLHQFIGFAIIRKIEELGGVSQFWIVIPIMISVVLATVVHYWIEIPAGRWLLDILDRMFYKHPEKGVKNG